VLVHEQLQMYKTARVDSCCVSVSFDNSITQTLHGWCSCCLVRSIFWIAMFKYLWSMSILV